MLTQEQVTLVIPSSNNLRHLKNAYTSIKTHAPNCKIIMLDDGSTDGTTEWLSSLKDDNITAIYRSSERVGHTVLYDKGIEFFSERRDMVIDALGKFKLSCPKLRSYIIEAMTKFTERFVIWDEKQQYDLLNKLNTNYSAAAYMITVELPEKYKTSVSFEDSLK